MKRWTRVNLNRFLLSLNVIDELQATSLVPTL